MNINNDSIELKTCVKSDDLNLKPSHVIWIGNDDTIIEKISEISIDELSQTQTSNRNL